MYDGRTTKISHREGKKDLFERECYLLFGRDNYLPVLNWSVGHVYGWDRPIIDGRSLLE